MQTVERPYEQNESVPKDCKTAVSELLALEFAACRRALQIVDLKAPTITKAIPWKISAFCVCVCLSVLLVL